MNDKKGNVNAKKDNGSVKERKDKEKRIGRTKDRDNANVSSSETDKEKGIEDSSAVNSMIVNSLQNALN